MKRGGPLKRYTSLRSGGALRKKAKKPRKPKASTLKKKLWKLFSEYIRRRDADENGMVACVTCGEVRHWKAQQAGHYVPKSLGLAVYFEERNVHTQDYACNIGRSGHLSRYALYMIKRYGSTILDELEALSRTQRKISTPEYLELIQAYSAKLKALGQLPEAA